MDKYAIGARLGEAAAARMGMNPQAQKAMGEFGRMAVPMVAGSYLQRSESPLVSGLGTALTYAPMFMGMMPKNLWGPDTPVGKTAPTGAPKTTPTVAPKATSVMGKPGRSFYRGPRTPQGLVPSPAVRKPKTPKPPTKAPKTTPKPKTPKVSPKTKIKIPRFRMGRFG